MLRKLAGVALAATLLGPGFGITAGSARAAAKKYPNCAALNKTYKHGVGRKGARDHVSGSSKPVTTFTVDNAVYTANRPQLDRDKDGIACEKR